MNKEQHLSHSPLGKTTQYHAVYQPELLFPVHREANRQSIDVTVPLPFYGHDIWNAYELSWLNSKGKPIVALAQFVIPCTSPYLIESKSLKLYLLSLHQCRFKHPLDLAHVLIRDLSHCAKTEVAVDIFPLETVHQKFNISTWEGICLDGLDIEVEQYSVDPSLLQCEETLVTETLCSHLLKSNCLITGQPDWGSIQIQYTGRKIKHEQLLKYLISFREHNEFHEHCVERIFMDIKKHCQPKALTVIARYTRRGGLDINPCRSTDPNVLIKNQRLLRQ